MSETIEKLLVELSADIKDYSKNLDKALKKTDRSTKDMQKDFDNLAKNTEKASSKMSIAIGSFAGVLGANVLTGAFNLATQAASGLFQALVIDGVAAAQVQEDAINMLNQSLRNAGRFSAEASQDMQNFASQLQSVTKVGDETTLELLSLANNFARSNEEAKKMVKAAIELDAAMGIGLDSALKNLGKTTSGLTGELGESLPALRSLTAEQLKAGAAVDLILNKFGGTAAQAVKTYSGALQQLTNAWGDTTELTGSAITQNRVVIDVINEVKSIIEELNNEIIANNDEFKALVGEGLVALIEGLGVVIELFDWLGRIGKVALASINSSLTAMQVPLRVLYNVITGDIKGAFTTLQVAGEEVAGNIKSAFDAFTEETLLDKLGNTLTRVGEAGKKAMREVGEEAVASSERVSNKQEEVAKLLEAERQFIDQLIIAKEGGVESELALLDYQKEQELQKLQAFRDNDKINEQEYLDAKMGLNKTYSDKRKALADKMAQAEAAEQQKRIQGVQSTLGALSSLQNSKNREMAEVAKGASIFNATISAYEGGNKAAAAVAGIPIVGPALAAAARISFIAAGIAQVNKIRGIPFQSGTDSVPGFGRGDRIPAILEPEERVVPRETNKDLTRYLKMQNENMQVMQMGGGAGLPIRLVIEMVGDAAEMLRARQIENSYLNVGVEGAI